MPSTPSALAMLPLPALLAGTAFVALVMAVLWSRQRRTRNAGVVDAAWAGGLGAQAVLLAATGEGTAARRLALALLTGSWGFRLMLHVARRVRHEREDGRYRRLREQWGAAADRNFLLFFEAQALLVGLLALPFAVVAASTAPFGRGADFVALALFATAIVGEAVADRQLRTFRADPRNRGRTCRVGLWRCSRHPNYFFEWLHWCSYVPLAWGAPLAWVTWIPPFLMLFLILKVTGIPPTEAQALASRGDDYRDYQRTTSAFVPWFPRRVRGAPAIGERP